MRVPRRRVAFLFGLVGLTTLGALGCGGSSGTVSGVVKFAGQPLPSGTVTFLCEGGDKPVKTAEIVDGKYSLPGLPVGPAKISVRTIAPSPPVQVPPGAPAPAPTTETPPGKYVPIPARYSNPDQSSLTYEVTGGSQTHDIDLQP